MSFVEHDADGGHLSWQNNAGTEIKHCMFSHMEGKHIGCTYGYRDWHNRDWEITDGREEGEQKLKKLSGTEAHHLKM